MVVSNRSKEYIESIGKNRIGVGKIRRNSKFSPYRHPTLKDCYMCPHCSNYVGLKTWKQHKKISANSPRQHMYKAFKQICPGCQLERSLAQHLYTRKEMRTCVKKNSRVQAVFEQQEVKKEKKKTITPILKEVVPQLRKNPTTIQTNKYGLVFPSGVGKQMLSYLKDYSGSQLPLNEPAVKRDSQLTADLTQLVGFLYENFL